MTTDQFGPIVQAPRTRIALPLILFVATCLSTYLTHGLAFCIALMFMLTAHELGHFFQARRYGVAASLPYFIPMPISPIGTLGAVIAMGGSISNRRALYDIGITGPLAGLVPAMAFSAVGLWFSEVRPIVPGADTLMLGEPLIFKLLAYSIFGALPDGTDIFLHPIAFAGWAGIFITALNLIPIGQLDGGHILYALLRQKAHAVSAALLVLATVLVVVMGYWAWTLMLLLLLMIGPKHAPTANDEIDLGRGRTVLGYVTLAFVLVGFTPTPFVL